MDEEKYINVDKDSNMPGTKDGMMIENYIFSPTDDIRSNELLEILRCFTFIIRPETFNRLPDNSKRHFIVQDRYGHTGRWIKKK